jgi:hypothetical protein
MFLFPRGRTDTRTRHRRSITRTRRRRLGQCDEFCLFARHTPLSLSPQTPIPCLGVVTCRRQARPRRPAARSVMPPLRLHTIRTRARGLAGRRTEHDDAILPVAGRWTAHRRRSLILHSTAAGRRIPGAVPGAQQTANR